MSSSHSVALAAPHSAAVEAAESLLQAGGNAVDAAVAAAASLAVVYPHMCSAGGDLIALIRDPRGRITCINASGAYGSGNQRRALLPPAGMPIDGPLTVTVPGAVSGWSSLLARAGTLPVGLVLAPAIEQAMEGVSVGQSLATAIQSHEDLLRTDPGMAQTFLPGGEPLREGDLLTQPALARTLGRLASDGLEDFYTGATAAALCLGFDQLGIPVTSEDLASHAVEARKPLTGSFGGLRIHTAPPNSQGYLLLETLGVMNLQGGESSLREVDAAFLAEVFWGADKRRDEVLGDPRWMSESASELLTSSALERAHHEARARLWGEHETRVASRGRPTGDTVAVTAVDCNGIAVSLIQSVFHAFGSGLLDLNTGVVLHNRGAFFNLEAGSPNELRPGKRPAHTLMPVIVENDAGLVAAHGTMGGKAQPQIHTQLILRTLDGLDPAEAVAAPRFVVGGLDAGTSRDGILMEPGIEDRTSTNLRGSRLDLEIGVAGDERVGHAMIARRDGNGSLWAGADPRSDGKALVH